ncbi:MAG: HlyD family efflux transporter periplasmic adaptor subunit [Planctomyces sp.]|nr:HlyD family efflux transporter periplasmic adaptor subunit [Planctomyces sp.]
MLGSGSSQTSGSMVASNERPIPLQKRADLKVANIDYLGVGYQVIKDPVALKYHRLQVEQYRILELLDGKRSLEKVREDLKGEFPALQVTLSDIQQLITDLHKKGLVISNRPGQGAAVIRERTKTRNDKIKQTLMSLLYLRLPGWDPERTLKFIHPFTAWLFHPFAVSVCMMFVVSAWLVLAANMQQLQGKLPEFQNFFGWPNLIYLWITMAFAKIIHEFGHGLSCVHYGGECHEMGVMLLVFSPCLYCDVTDSWMMKNKWHRIIIGAAGMYIEVILSAVAIYIWWFTKPGLLNYLALNTFFVTTITTVIFNANPLMRFDGYYMMSDFLEIPNLRQKSDKLLREAFAWYCLGIESRPDPFMPETGRAWFVTYAIAAWLYRWVVLVSISMFFYTVLKPYDLQSLGITMMVFSMGGVVFAMFKNVYQIIAAPRMEPMSKIKIAFSLSVLGGLGWLACTIPIPWYHEAPFFLEPRKVASVNAPFTGQIVQPAEYAKRYEQLDALEKYTKDKAVLLMDLNFRSNFSLIEGLPSPDEYRALPKNGDSIEQREVLAIIEDENDIRNRDDMVQNAYRWAARTDEALVLLRQNDLLKSREALAEVIILEERIRELARLSATRVVRSPISGTIVAAKRIPEPVREETDPTKLQRWHGTPLDERNAGCFVEIGQELLTIAPTSELHAVLYVDQGDRDDIEDTMKVELKLDHLPDVTYVSKVAEFSPRGELLAPESLTTRFQGPLNTTPDAAGKEKLASTAYRAIVRMDFSDDSNIPDSVLMKPGMRGNARFIIENRTAFQWVKRYLYETFRFRV